MPAKVESTPSLPGLPPVSGKPLVARFDSGRLSSDGGVLALSDYLDAHNADPKPFRWTALADTIISNHQRGKGLLKSPH